MLDDQRPPVAPLCGLLNLNKPAGMTSRAVVDLVARPLKARKIKVGHAGTLDPLATGVLVIAVGPATRLVESIQRQAKTYRALIRLGAESDTCDADGNIREKPAARLPPAPAIRDALATQLGTIQQRPPEYSALKVAGRRAHELARRGEAVVLQARPVRIDHVELIDYAWPWLEIRVDCGAGTYIRSMARDLGETLGCGGYIERLTRTRIGAFRIEEALDPRELTVTVETLSGLLLPAIEAVPDLPRVSLDADGLAKILRGQAIVEGPDEPPIQGSGEVALLDPDGRLVGLGVADGRGRVQPRRVLGGGSTPAQ